MDIYFSDTFVPVLKKPGVLNDSYLVYQRKVVN